MAKAFHIAGQVIDGKTRQGIAGLRIEPWDKALLINKSLGSSLTDAQGAFLFDLDKSDLKTLFASRRIVLSFKVLRGNEVIAGTENPAVWDQDEPDKQVSIEIGAPLPERFVVKGQVHKTNTAVLANSPVRVFGTAGGAEKLLAETKTDEAGRYEAAYSPGQFAADINPNAKIIVRAFDDKANAVAFSPAFSASLEQKMDIVFSAALPEPFTIRGLIRDNTGKPSPDRVVRLFGKNVVSGNERLLGQAITDLDGRYFVQYDPGEFKASPDDSNRLAVRVFDGQGRLLDPASPLFRAQPEENVDITLTTTTSVPPVIDPPVDPKDLDACRQKLNEVRQALAAAEQNQALLRRTIQEREQLIMNQQSLISELQRRINTLEEVIRETGQREAVEPGRLGSALGETVDAIQQGLTNLQNQFVDYGLQELDVNTQVNLQVSSDGRLLMRFPGLNEEVAPQNLSQLQLRLRPIPKSQK